METRLATLDDAPRLAALHAAGFKHGAWNLEQITQSMNLPTTTTWVVAFQLLAPLSGAAAGEAGIQGFIMLQQTGDEAEILTLCTAPEARRRGIAALLAQTAIAAAAQTSGKIFLEVAADNIAAQKLYEKQGFTITGKRAGYYRRDNGAADALVLSLELSIGCEKL